MRTQYGLSLYSDEFKRMSWNEFKALLTGIDGETPLGRIVQIRSENDPDMLKHFSQGQHAIRNEWRNRLAKEKTSKEIDNYLEQIKQAFIELAK